VSFEFDVLLHAFVCPAPEIRDGVHLWLHTFVQPSAAMVSLRGVLLVVHGCATWQLKS